MTKRKIWIADYKKLQLYNLDDPKEIKQFKDEAELFISSVEHTPLYEDVRQLKTDAKRILSCG